MNAQDRRRARRAKERRATEATAQQAAPAITEPLIARDDLRAMLHDGVFLGHDTEEKVRAARAAGGFSPPAIAVESLAADIAGRAIARAQEAGVLPVEEALDPLDVTLAAVAEQLAPAAEPGADGAAIIDLFKEDLLVLAIAEECADCGHAEMAHTDGTGACTAEDCSCGAFAAAEEDQPTDAPVAAAGSSVTVEFRIDSDDTGHFIVTPGGVRVPLLPNTSADAATMTFTSVALPPEMTPGETLPDANPSPGEPVVPTSGDGYHWTAVLCPEGVLTDDGRAFAPGSITWRELPLSLMAMTQTADGHDGAEIAGRIDAIWRDEAGLIRGEGTFDSGEYGSMIARLVGEGTLRGISVDIAARSYEMGPRSDFFDDAGQWQGIPAEDASEEPTDLLEILFGNPDDDVVYVVTDGVIGATTVCPFQAFADATIELSASLVAASSPLLWTVTGQAGFVVTALPQALVASGDGIVREGIEVPPDGTVVTLEVLTAAAAGLAPLKPPADWFANPGLDELTPLTIDDDGRIVGHAWAWDTCHIGIPGGCTVAPHSNTEYAYFHLGEVECEDGERVPCGRVTLDTGHADRRLGRADTTAHYDHTGAVAAHIVCGEDEHGGWVAGAINPELSEEKLRILRGAVLSGDWRSVNGNLELVALLAVNVPGFPVPRTRALVASGDEGAEVLALTAAGLHNGPQTVSLIQHARMLALADVAAGRFAALAAEAHTA